MPRWVAFVVLATGTFAAGGGAFARAAAPALTIEQITVDKQRVRSASGVTLRGLDGSLIRLGVREGESLPDDVQVTVPAGARIRVGTPSLDAVALEATTDVFHYTGKFESVATLAPGRTEVSEPSDTFRIFGQTFEVIVHDGSAAIDVAERRATVTWNAGGVTTKLLGSSTAFVRRVDVLAQGRRSITYAYGDAPIASATVADDKLGAAAGDPNAEFNLGMRFYLGDGIAPDPAQAMRWLRAAAAQRFAEAENSIGYAYAYAPPHAEDIAQALHWFLLAAGGSAAAEDTLGDMYQYGHGVPQSYVQAMRWYALAAAEGDADAENDIGLLYYVGQGNNYGGSQPQYAEAMRWFRIAAATGNGDAENDVGYAYEQGHGVSRDYAQAFTWYGLSAAQHDRAAEYNLGRMYERGLGVAQNYPQALHWYRLAAAQGSPGATAAIQRIEKLHA